MTEAPIPMTEALTADTLRAHMCGVAANLCKRRACQCPVCMDVMTAPARLKCRHVFCTSSAQAFSRLYGGSSRRLYGRRCRL